MFISLYKIRRYDGSARIIPLSWKYFAYLFSEFSPFLIGMLFKVSKAMWLIGLCQQITSLLFVVTDIFDIHFIYFCKQRYRIVLDKKFFFLDIRYYCVWNLSIVWCNKDSFLTKLSYSRIYFSLEWREKIYSKYFRHRLIPLLGLYWTSDHQYYLATNLAIMFYQ